MGTGTRGLLDLEGTEGLWVVVKFGTHGHTEGTGALVGLDRFEGTEGLQGTLVGIGLD